MNDNNKLDITANLAQLYSLYLLLQDASNNDLMQELQNQDTKYFEDIVDRLERIESLLRSLISVNR